MERDALLQTVYKQITLKAYFSLTGILLKSILRSVSGTDNFTKRAFVKLPADGANFPKAKLKADTNLHSESNRKHAFYYIQLIFIHIKRSNN